MTDDRVQAFLRGVRDRGDDQFEIVSRVRDIALASGPSVTEEVKYGGVLFASSDGFCGVFSYAGHVTLEFSQGALLPDPHAVLTGSGKGRRHIKLLTPSDIETKHVAEYVDAARRAADG